MTDFAVDALLKQFGIPFPFDEILSAVVAALVSTGLLYLLDKLDLFSTKSEKRLARVREIFDLRINGIKEATKNFDIAAHETLKNQRAKFELLRGEIASALKNKDMVSLNDSIDNVADFFKVDIPYSSSEEFLQYVRRNDRIIVGA